MCNLLDLILNRVKSRSQTSSEVDLQKFFEMRQEIERINKDKPRESIAQSLDEKVMTETEGDKQEVNVTFTDAVEQYQLMIGRNLSDPTYDMHKNGFDDLSTFMQRPIQIYSKVWDVNESPDYSTTFNPWELFLNDPKVLNKIETFKLLHGTLRLKFMLNGSPFHYGRMFVGVRPSKFDNNNTVLTPVTSVTSVVYRDENNGGTKSLDVAKCLYSQRPHVYLDPSTNQPQEITWPFFAQYNWIDLADPETVNRLGRIEIWELNKLQHANSATDPVTISCLAWMEDVKFAGLTAITPSVAQSMTSEKPKKSKSKPTLTGEQGKGKDEYKPNGVISGPATTVAAVADYFTEIPIIGTYAKATSMAANAVSDIARLFGFSKPPVLTDTVIVRPQNIGNLSNVIGTDPIQKLSLDPKQELTVDPRTVGLTGEDQMSFGYLTKREAYIDYFNWNTVGTQNTGLLYSIRVHPCIAPVLSGYAYLQTPLSFVTRPFTHWSGAIRFRFQIVAAQQHRGRLLFVYEPSPSIAGTIADTNDRFAHIVDISQERDVTFEINWTQYNAYRFTELDEATNDWAIEGPIGSMTASGNDLSCNGRLNVYALTELAAPITTSNVQVNVFISGGDNYEVKNPRRDFGTKWAYGTSSAQSLAQGMCFSRRQLEIVPPPELPIPPPELNLGPPPPVRWEETDSSSSSGGRRSTVSSFEDRLAEYAARFPGFNRSGRLHAEPDRRRDENDSHSSLESARNDPEFDDDQFSQAQSMSGGGSQVTNQENAPEHDMYYVLNGRNCSYCPEQSDVYYGEAIVSFRTLLKRYNFHRMLATTNENLTAPSVLLNQFRLWTVPVGPGPSYGSSVASALTQIENPGVQNYNICAMTYMRYIIPAYIGYRGGIRWKYTCTNSNQDRMLLKVTRGTIPLFQEAYSATELSGVGYSRSMTAQIAYNNGTIAGATGGSAQTAPSVNPTLEVEFPFISNFRYAECNEPPSQSPPDSRYSQFAWQNHYLTVMAYYPSAEAPNYVIWDSHCSTAEDFSLFFFIGAPILFESDVGSVTPQGS